jgi:hypothetical protein
MWTLRFRTSRAFADLREAAGYLNAKNAVPLKSCVSGHWEAIAPVGQVDIQ